MSRQLIYTSAPRGLRRGTRGFCTVAASPELPPPLIARLEALSAYRFAYNVSDSRAGSNPVAFSYVRLRLGRTTHAVLSRIGPTAADYSGRSNFIAHHLLPDAAELVRGGPASVLDQPGLFVDRWEGPPRQLERASLSEEDDKPGVCRGWQRVAGDAGWGGVLCDALDRSPGEPIYVVYPPGVELLPLFRESLALLPVERRWSVTFSTYMTTAAPDIECRWRGVLAETAEARQIPARAFVVDLASGLGAPPSGPATEAARQGRPIEPRGRGEGRIVAATDAPAAGSASEAITVADELDASTGSARGAAEVEAAESDGDPFAAGAEGMAEPPPRPEALPPGPWDRRGRGGVDGRRVAGVAGVLLAMTAGFVVGLSLLSGRQAEQEPSRTPIAQAPAEASDEGGSPTAVEGRLDGGAAGGEGVRLDVDMPRPGDAARNEAAEQPADAGGEEATEEPADMLRETDPGDAGAGEAEMEDGEAASSAEPEPTAARTWQPTSLERVDEPPVADGALVVETARPLDAGEPIELPGDIDRYYWREYGPAEGRGVDRGGEGVIDLIDTTSRPGLGESSLGTLTAERSGGTVRIGWSPARPPEQLPAITLVLIGADDAGRGHVLYHVPPTVTEQAGSITLSLREGEATLPDSPEAAQRFRGEAGGTARREEGELSLELPVEADRLELNGKSIEATPRLVLRPLSRRSPDRARLNASWRLALVHDADELRRQYDAHQQALSEARSAEAIESDLEEATDDEDATERLREELAERTAAERGLRERAEDYNALAEAIEAAVERVGRITLLDRFGVPMRTYGVRVASDRLESSVESQEDGS